MQTVRELGQRAVAAARVLANASTDAKDAGLVAAADLLVERAPEILAANAEDIRRAEAAGTPDTVVDRLRLDDRRIAGVASGLRQVAALAGPGGVVSEGLV